MIKKFFQVKAENRERENLIQDMADYLYVNLVLISNINEGCLTHTAKEMFDLMLKHRFLTEQQHAYLMDNIEFISREELEDRARARLEKSLGAILEEKGKEDDPTIH